MSTKTHRDRLFEAVKHKQVVNALKEARRLANLGRCISDAPGSGPSSVYFVRDEYGDLYPAKAVMRYAMRENGLEPKRDNLDFLAVDAKAILGDRHNFDLVELRGADERASELERAVQNRHRRQANILARPQQARFRGELLNAFNSRCAVSKTNCGQALQAAHVFPVSLGGKDDVGNGLLLRADIHILFDIGLVEINANTFIVKVSGEAGKDYTIFNGIKINHPQCEKFKQNLTLRKI